MRRGGREYEKRKWRSKMHDACWSRMHFLLDGHATSAVALCAGIFIRSKRTKKRLIRLFGQPLINVRLTRAPSWFGGVVARIAGIQVIGSRGIGCGRFGHAIIYFPACVVADDDYPTIAAQLRGTNWSCECIRWRISKSSSMKLNHRGVGERAK